MQGANHTHASLNQNANRLSGIQVSGPDISYQEIARPSIMDVSLKKDPILI
jgi:hypothetical protein